MVHQLVLASPDPALWRLLPGAEARPVSSGASDAGREARAGEIRDEEEQPARPLEAALL
jgi:hypothetical protein